MHSYRTHTCNELTLEHAGRADIRLSGWIHRKRSHGGLLFVDLRDHYGITQLVFNPGSELDTIERLGHESVIRVDGEVRKRIPGAENPSLKTGDVELHVFAVTILSKVEEVPVPVFGEPDYPEDMRLKYRYLDLRRPGLHQRIELRSKIIETLRSQMRRNGFTEYQTPILTASSPEGARDFLVPSRLHPGKFYALPQAPQQFKQLLMVSGFDRYFQIAPCFRDESSRSDRSPGEFYQLDLEMAFVTQDEVFKVTEEVLLKTFMAHMGPDKEIDLRIPRIPYREAIRRFGTDKPDLRNPLEFEDVSHYFKDGEFKVFADILNTPGNEVWAILAPNISGAFARHMNDWAISQGQAGLAATYSTEAGRGGPVAKAIGQEASIEMLKEMSGNPEDGIFFVAGDPTQFYKFAGLLRNKLSDEMPDLINQNRYQFCWIIDFPMYELDDHGKVAFSHNPFSMPQGEMTALEEQDPLDILAYQYDLVCNGIELSSGAIRNHRPEVMIKAFELAGYSAETVEEKFGGMLNAFRCGAPPHGGIAPGVDRIVMLLAGVDNIKDVIAFPLDSQGRDLMMNAPSEVTETQLKELNIAPRRF